MEPTTFMQSIPLFVNQVYDVDHINLFLSGLRCALCPGGDHDYDATAVAVDQPYHTRQLTGFATASV